MVAALRSKVRWGTNSSCLYSTNMTLVKQLLLGHDERLPDVVSENLEQSLTERIAKFHKSHVRDGIDIVRLTRRKNSLAESDVPHQAGFERP